MNRHKIAPTLATILQKSIKLAPFFPRYQSSRYIDCQCPKGYEGRYCEEKTISDETSANPTCPRRFLEFEVEPVFLSKVRTYFLGSYLLFLKYMSKFLGAKNLKKQHHTRFGTRFGPIHKYLS